MRSIRTALVAFVLTSSTIPHNALGCSKHGTNAGNDIGVSAAVGGLAVAGEIIVPDDLVVVPTQPTTATTHPRCAAPTSGSR